MKQLQIDLNNKEKLLLVEVPVNAYDFGWFAGIFMYQMPGLSAHKILREVDDFMETISSKTKAEVLGTYTPRTGEIDFEVKEEWVEMVDMSLRHDYLTYQVYNGEKIFAATPKESFESLLKHETEKAFPLKENFFADEDKDSWKYQENESKVLPERFVVILVR